MESRCCPLSPYYSALNLRLPSVSRDSSGNKRLLPAKASLNRSHLAFSDAGMAVLAWPLFCGPAHDYVSRRPQLFCATALPSYSAVKQCELGSKALLSHRVQWEKQWHLLPTIDDAPALRLRRVCTFRRIGIGELNRFRCRFRLGRGSWNRFLFRIQTGS